MYIYRYKKSENLKNHILEFYEKLGQRIPDELVEEIEHADFDYSILHDSSLENFLKIFNQWSNHAVEEAESDVEGIKRIAEKYLSQVEYIYNL